MSMATPPLHISCASAPYLSERGNEKNVPNVIESFLSLHGSAITVPPMNGKLLLGLLIAYGASWADGVGIFLCVNPTALLYDKYWPEWLPIHNFKSRSRGMIHFRI